MFRRLFFLWLVVDWVLQYFVRNLDRSKFCAMRCWGRGLCKLSHNIFCICVLSSIDFVQQILVVKLCPYKNIECVLHILFVFYAVYLYFTPEVDFVQKIWGWFCMWNHVISKLHISGSLSRKSLPSRANRWPFAETWWSHICISILSFVIKTQKLSTRLIIIIWLKAPPHPDVDFSRSWKVPKSRNQFAHAINDGEKLHQFAVINGKQSPLKTLFYHSVSILWLKLKARTHGKL